jgi:hypothetical protein
MLFFELLRVGALDESFDAGSTQDALLRCCTELVGFRDDMPVFKDRESGRAYYYEDWKIREQTEGRGARHSVDVEVRGKQCAIRSTGPRHDALQQRLEAAAYHDESDSEESGSDESSEAEDIPCAQTGRSASVSGRDCAIARIAAKTGERRRPDSRGRLSPDIPLSPSVELGDTPPVRKRKRMAFLDD